MEYIQTVLVQIEASRLERASESGGLLSELDEHRSFLKQQPGFRDLRITRSINPEGNVLLMVETRWSDDAGLVHYETGETNVAGIVNSHRDVIVSDSLQVLDMEALRTESSWAPAEAATAARDRVALPLLIPLGVLAFALLVIYGLSRVYLSLSGDGPVALAAGIAIGVLIIASYIAYNPRVSGAQIGAIMAVAAIALIGGSIWGIMEDNGAGHALVEQPTETAEPGESPAPGGAGDLAITLGDNFFEYEGAKKPTISVTAGEAAVFDLTNAGKGTHNMHVAAGGEYDTELCGVGDDDPCSDPDTIRGGKTATITITIDEPGTYDFRCDFHVAEMTGTLEVQ
jgi:plastocyanin